MDVECYIMELSWGHSWVLHLEGMMEGRQQRCKEWLPLSIKSGPLYKVKQEIESHPGGAGRQASRLEMLAVSAESL